MQSSLQTGMTLCGKYKILQKIGKGGMAFVYKAFSIYHNKECALKEMQDQYLDPESKDKITAQFMNEAVTLSKLDHPGVPYVLETFELEGKHYLAMEYVAGDTLEDFVMNSPSLLTQDQVLGIVWQIIDILKYLHNLPEPVILRDLKPSNIMLNKEGKIKIIDFGIAKVFEQGNASRTMAKIKGSGSSGFAPPEQYGAAGTDKRSDIYAFGVTIYYLLTGEILEDSVDRILKGGKFEHVKNINPTAGNAIQAMIEKMVQLKPADRFQNVEEIIDYLNKNGMNGKYPLLKPNTEFPEMTGEEDKSNDDEDEEQSSADLEEDEEDTTIYLPRQVYNKRKTSESEIENKEESLSSQRKSDITNRFSPENMPLQTEKLLGSGGIAEGIKSDGSLKKSSEEASHEATRKLDKSDIEKYLKERNIEITQPTKKEEKSKEVKEVKPFNWGCAFVIFLMVLIIGLIGYGLYVTRSYWMTTPEKIQKQEQEKINAQKTAEQTKEKEKKEVKPVITYTEQHASGKISAVEKIGNSKHLILKSDKGGYVKIKPGKEGLPEGLKVGSEVRVIYKIPKTNPKQPYEILKIKLKNIPKKQTTSSSSSNTTKSSSSGSSNYSSGSSTYTPPPRSSSSSSNYSSGSSTYTPPPRSSS
ncbi:protein kinase, partial [bacterium]|nr:protein kinase [bacterium]